MIDPAHRQSRREEAANSLTHGLGLLLAIAGLAVLAVSASRAGTARTIAGCVVFGAALVLLYGTSTLYHAVEQPRAKGVLRALDHSAIFILIAGTYTPFTLVSLRGPWGGRSSPWCGGSPWPASRCAWPSGGGHRSLRRPLPGDGVVRRGGGEATRGRRAAGGIALLAAGGLAYSGGVVFYLWRRLPYHHAVWHAFVLAGSAFHYAAVLRYIALA